MWHASSRPFSWALNESASAASSTAANREKSISSKSILPASIFDRSRISLMIVMRWSADLLTIPKSSLWLSVRSVSINMSAIPITPFMGVRISWLMLARNSLFALLALSASILAFLSAAWIWFCAVTSRKFTTMPTDSPFASRSRAAPRQTSINSPSFLYLRLSKSVILSPPKTRFTAFWVADSASSGTKSIRLPITSFFTHPQTRVNASLINTVFPWESYTTIGSVHVSMMVLCRSSLSRSASSAAFCTVISSFNAI